MRTHATNKSSDRLSNGFKCFFKMSNIKMKEMVQKAEGMINDLQVLIDSMADYGKKEIKTIY